MRKTFEELMEPIMWETSLVGDKSYSQDDNTPEDECYWISVKEVKQLLKLIRISSLEEGINKYSAFIESYCTTTLPDCDEFIKTLDKDSIEL